MASVPDPLGALALAPFPVGDVPLAVSLTCPVCGGAIEGEARLGDMGMEWSGPRPGSGVVELTYLARIPHTCRKVTVTITREVVED